MKTSRNKKRMIISIVVAALAIVAAILVFDNQQKKAATETETEAATETRAEDQQTATLTPTPTTTDDEPGSLWDEETIRFNGVDLIKKDIPEWLVNAIKEDDPVVVARTIAKNPTFGDFKVRRIFGKSPGGFYCLHEGYVRREGDEISVANGGIKINLEEPTVNLTIPDADELSFEFVEALIKLLWEREQKSFWTERYEHFVEIKEAPFPSEQAKENCIFIDGEFISIMPDTATPEPEENPHKYADRYFTRSVVWYSDETETFYTITSYDSMIKKWKWSPTASHYWEGTGKVPTLPEDSVISTGWQGTYCWYVVKGGEEDEVTVYEPYEFPESKGEFGIQPVLEMKFKGVGIARPFVIHEGNEGGWETAYVATPETNTLWKISGHGVYKKELTALEVTGNKVVAQNDQTIEILANRMDDSSYGTWVGYYTGGDYEFQEVVSFEKELEKLKTSGNLKIEGGEIVIEIDDIEITLF